MSRNTKSPGIQQVRRPEDVPRAWEGVRALLEQWKGSGDPLDAVITKRDLYTLGETEAFEIRRDGSIRNPKSGSPTDEGRREPGIQFPVVPRGLTADSGFNTIFLKWDDPNEAYNGHAYTEVWRADTDDLGQAVLIDSVSGYLYPDEFNETYAVTRYYWIRWVNTNGQAGPFSSTSGVSGNTSNSPDVVRDLLTSKDWQASHAYGLFEVIRPNVSVVRNGLTLHFQVSVSGTSGASEPDWTVVSALGDTLTDGSVTWTAIEASQAPFVTGTINGEPVVYMPGAFIEDATITNAKILNVSADKLTAGTIDAAVIDVINLQAENILGDEITGITIQTSNNVQTDGGFIVSADDGEGRYYGDIGDGSGTIEELISNGIKFDGPDGVIFWAGSPNTTHHAGRFQNTGGLATLFVEKEGSAAPSSALVANNFGNNGGWGIFARGPEGGTPNSAAGAEIRSTGSSAVGPAINLVTDPQVAAISFNFSYSDTSPPSFGSSTHPISIWPGADGSLWHWDKSVWGRTDRSTDRTVGTSVLSYTLAHRGQSYAAGSTYTLTGYSGTWLCLESVPVGSGDYAGLFQRIS